MINDQEFSGWSTIMQGNFLPEPPPPPPPPRPEQSISGGRGYFLSKQQRNRGQIVWLTFLLEQEKPPLPSSL
jgi:hypothetical protein